MTARVALVVLAAGQSLRFCGDKLQYPIDGVPMLLRTLRLYASDALSDAFVSRTVVLNRSRESFAAAAKSLGYRVVFNEHPESGQSQSVRLGALDALPGQPDGILFSVADQPYLSETTVRRLADAFAAAPDRIVLPAADGRRGNPVLFPIALCEKLCELTGDVGGNVVIRQHPNLLLPVETPAQELQDIDRRTEE